MQANMSSLVLRKTERGEREFRGARSLPQKVRGVLILVNGVRAGHEIAAMLPMLPVVETLRVLLAATYVEPVDGRALPAGVRTTPRGGVRAAQAAAPGAGGSLPSWARELQAVAIAQIDGLAGEAAAMLVARLRTCRRPGELRMEIERATQQLGLFVGAEVAALFREEMGQRFRASGDGKPGAVVVGADLVT